MKLIASFRRRAARPSLVDAARTLQARRTSRGQALGGRTRSERRAGLVQLGFHPGPAPEAQIARVPTGRGGGVGAPLLSASASSDRITPARPPHSATSIEPAWVCLDP